MTTKLELIEFLSKFEDLDDALELLKSEYNLDTLVKGDTFKVGNASLSRRLEYFDGALVPEYVLSINGDESDYQDFIFGVYYFLTNKEKYNKEYSENKEVVEMVNDIESDALLDLHSLFKTVKL